MGWRRTTSALTLAAGLATGGACAGQRTQVVSVPVWGEVQRQTGVRTERADVQIATRSGRLAVLPFQVDPPAGGVEMADELRRALVDAAPSMGGRLGAGCVGRDPCFSVLGAAETASAMAARPEGSQSEWFERLARDHGVEHVITGELRQLGEGAETAVLLRVFSAVDGRVYWARHVASGDTAVMVTHLIEAFVGRQTQVPVYETQRRIVRFERRLVQSRDRGVSFALAFDAAYRVSVIEGFSFMPYLGIHVRSERFDHFVLVGLGSALPSGTCSDAGPGLRLLYGFVHRTDDLFVGGQVALGGLFMERCEDDGTTAFGWRSERSQDYFSIAGMGGLNLGVALLGLTVRLAVANHDEVLAFSGTGVGIDVGPTLLVTL